MLTVPVDLDPETIKRYEGIFPEYNTVVTVKRQIARFNKTKSWFNSVVARHRHGKYGNTETMVPYILKHLNQIVEGHSVIQFINHVRNHSPELPNTRETITDILFCLLDLCDQGVVKLSPNKQYFGISIASDRTITLSDAEIDAAWKLIKPHIRLHALHPNTCLNLILSHITQNREAGSRYLEAFVARGLI